MINPPADTAVKYVMKIQAIPAFEDNYIWLITYGDREAIVVDPGDAKPVIDTLEHLKLNLKAILITHHCWDHIGGIDPLIAKHPAPIYGPATNPIPQLNHGLKDNDTIQLGELQLTALHTPGHTHEHIVFYNNKILFSGDTLFGAGCGRLHTQEPYKMHDSLNKIKTLPKQLLVYCAHEYTLANLKFALAVEPNNVEIHKRVEVEKDKRSKGLATIPSTVELELQTNPFLRCDKPEVKMAAEKFCGRQLDSEAEVFKIVRYWKDTFA